MARKRKRSEPEESGGGYNWMDTYGDLVTNLLCFFVLLYAFSSVDSAKWNRIVEAFSGGTGSNTIAAFDVGFAREDAISLVDPMVNYENREESDPRQPDSSNVEEDPSTGEVFDGLYEKIQAFIEENELEDNMSVIRTEDIITIRFGEVFLFDTAEAYLKAQSFDLLEKVVQLIEENISSIKEITIEGHTDNLPIHSLQYGSNWELSTARAVNTLQKVLSYNVIDPSFLTASGCGEYRPVDTNDTVEGRSHNRRVDFVIEKRPE